MADSDLINSSKILPSESENMTDEAKISTEMVPEMKTEDIPPSVEENNDLTPLDLHRSPKTPMKSDPDDSMNKSTDSKKSTASDNSEKKKRKRKPQVTKKVSAEPDSVMSSPTQDDVELNIPTTVIHSGKPSPQESDTETIDKIAQMVSSITEATSPVIETSIPGPAVEKELKVEDEMAKIFGDELMKLENNEADDKVPAVSDIPKKKSAKRKTPANSNGEKKPAKKRKPAENGKKSKKAAIEAAEKEKEEEKLSKDKKKKEKQKAKSDVAPFVKLHKDGNFSIVNQIVNGDDENDKSNGKAKKSQKPEKKIRGLHVSTLSNKYDADKRDLSWICVFCKLGPHKHKLGDLFGPYIVNQKSEEFRYAAQDPATDPFRQTNKNKFQKKVNTPTEKSPKKKKKSLPNSPNNGAGYDEIFDGMCKIDDDNFEVWFHEDCIAWSEGVHMIGSKIIGMEAAIWSSTRYRCLYCFKNGAMMTCLNRDCKKTGHFGCALKESWQLTDEFKTFCGNH